MKKPINNWIKYYLNFSKKDRNAILLLCMLIFLVLAGNITVDNIQLEPESNFTEIEYAIEKWENKIETNRKSLLLFRFNPNEIKEERLDSLSIPDEVKRNILSYREAGGKFYTKSDIRKIYGMNDSIFSAIEDYIEIKKFFTNKNQQKKSNQNTYYSFDGSFDPNQADVNKLYKFGFTRFQAENVIKYRKHGGIFRKPSDLLRIYGMDSLFYLSVERHIRIDSLFANSFNKKPKKIIELNSADSITLLQLYGIGPVYASRIIKYRDLLGGYYSKRQLLEVYNLPKETYQEIKSDLVVDTTLLKPIRLNFATFSELLRHPYVDIKQVEAIMEYREKNGSFHSLHQLLDPGLIDEQTYKVIRPYLSCR